MKTVSLGELEHKQLKNHSTGESYSLSGVISDFFGSKQVFLVHDVLLPGQKTSASYRHSIIEEIVYISKGNLTLKIGERSQAVAEGSFVFFDPQDTELHCLVNESGIPAEFMSFSVNRQDDAVIYNNNEAWRPPTLETPRMILRAIELSDAESIFSYARNPNVSRYTCWEAHQTIDDSLDYIKNNVFDHYAHGVPEPFGMTLKENPERVIGTVGCFWASRQNRAMELAYVIGEDFWGKGFAVEAAQVVMDYCFKEYSLKRIQARCFVENKLSARVMEKAGMVYEGTLKAVEYHRDQFWDMHYYAKVIK